MQTFTYQLLIQCDTVSDENKRAHSVLTHEHEMHFERLWDVSSSLQLTLQKTVDILFFVYIYQMPPGSLKSLRFQHMHGKPFEGYSISLQNFRISCWEIKVVTFILTGFSFRLGWYRSKTIGTSSLPISRWTHKLVAYKKLFLLHYCQEIKIRHKTFL